MKIVIAIDSFKGCLTSRQANQAAAAGVGAACPGADMVQLPVSDGGEGFVEAFHAAIGGQLVTQTVSDPLMRPVEARYLLCGVEAVIESAQACGLTLLTTGELNPMAATSYGVGQLVADAVRRGASHIIVGLGGSATSDAGMGMLRALIDTFAAHGVWDDVKALSTVRLTIATDVSNPLYGQQGAARVFAPQKGATPEMVLSLDERARKFANLSAIHFGYDCSHLPGAGAAGGLGYAFMQYLHANCRSGVELMLEAARFQTIIRHADLIITGEGSADRQTLMGKLPEGILRHAAGVPVCLIAGRVTDREALLHAGFAQVECVNPVGMPLEEAMRTEVAMRNIGRTAGDMAKNMAKKMSPNDFSPFPRWGCR